MSEFTEEELRRRREEGERQHKELLALRQKAKDEYVTANRGGKREMRSRARKVAPHLLAFFDAIDEEAG